MVNHMAQTDVPLFVSRRRLARYKTPPRAAGIWALDSGGFTQLKDFGQWTFTVGDYIREMQWAAPMDWMCEEKILLRTGRTVAEHQSLTVDNFIVMQWDLPNVVIPVLQGWTLDDYLRCIELYQDRGVDLTEYPVVGIGSVCRRNATDQVVSIISRLSAEGIRCHGFGVKGRSMRALEPLLASADSMAWSYDARRGTPLSGHTHKNCANCLPYALAWRTKHITPTKEEQHA
jgi:hypothetical protein